MSNESANGVLVCRSIVRRFREGDSTLEVLSGVDLTVGESELVAIVGASGSGKTTLLQIMGGLDDPTSGEVHVGGQSIANIDEKHKSALRNKFIGFVYQFHHLLPEFTAQENVAMPLLIRRLAKEEAMQKAADLLGRVGLEGRLDHKPGELSGGERQRAAVARVLPSPARSLRVPNSFWPTNQQATWMRGTVNTCCNSCSNSIVNSTRAW
jgi:lipoprotein-releasing system ATP-binding protein